jgi:cyclopropane fatty-acyl-phospholipid synthase-like methyltransferase
MKEIDFPLSLKIYQWSFQLLAKLHRGMNAIFSGFWLGVLDRESLHRLDQLYYDHESMYWDEDYNRQEIQDFEQEVFPTYFQPPSTLLLACAGGGREIFLLNQMGHQVDAFESNPNLVEFANKLLQKDGIATEVRWAPRDTCPTFDKTYDGLIVGWGGYLGFQGQRQRIEFLKQMRAHAKPGAPILMSFFHRDRLTPTFADRLTLSFANFIRAILWQEKIEPGDSLYSHNKIFVHYFTQEEIEFEMAQAGFQLVLYNIDNYGYAVGKSA